MKLRYRPGAFASRTPCGVRVIAFKWPGRPPPEKNMATPLSNDIINPSVCNLIWAHCWKCWINLVGSQLNGDISLKIQRIAIYMFVDSVGPSKKRAFKICIVDSLVNVLSTLNCAKKQISWNQKVQENKSWKHDTQVVAAAVEYSLRVFLHSCELQFVPLWSVSVVSDRFTSTNLDDISKFEVEKYVWN